MGFACGDAVMTVYGFLRTSSCDSVDVNRTSRERKYLINRTQYRLMGFGSVIIERNEFGRDNISGSISYHA